MAQIKPVAREKPRAQSVPRRRAAWDSSVSDLTAYRASPPEIESRKAKMRSHNAYQARAELDPPGFADVRKYVVGAGGRLLSYR